MPYLENALFTIVKLKTQKLCQLYRYRQIQKFITHFITTTSRNSTVKCRLPNTYEGDDDQIRLQLRALNHLVERNANQPNAIIEDHRDDDDIRKARCLVICAEDGLLAIVKLLLERKANVHVDDDYVLRWASADGHLEVVKLLLKHGANVHAGNDYALRMASENGRLEVVNFLKILYEN